MISVEEQLGGWYTSLRQTKKRDELAQIYQRLAENVELLVGFRILTFSESAMLRRDNLRRSKLNVRNNDLSIGAIALEHNAVVVTRNVVDFGRIPGLTIEDWSK